MKPAPRVARPMVTAVRVGRRLFPNFLFPSIHIYNRPRVYREYKFGFGLVVQVFPLDMGRDGREGEV